MQTYLKSSLEDYDQEAEDFILNYFSNKAYFFLNNLDAHEYFVTNLMLADTKYDPSKGLTQKQYKLYFMRLKVKEFWRKFYNKKQHIELSKEILNYLSYEDDHYTDELLITKEKINLLKQFLTPKQKDVLNDFLITGCVSQTARNLKKSVSNTHAIMKLAISNLRKLFMFNLKLAVLLYSNRDNKVEVFTQDGKIPIIPVEKDIKETLFSNFKGIFGFDPQWVQYNFSGVVENEEDLYLVLPIFSEKVKGEYSSTFEGLDGEFFRAAFIT